MSDIQEKLGAPEEETAAPEKLGAAEERKWPFKSE
jgi:hypothetical protein